MSETIIIRRTGQAPLRIRGELLASSESNANNASSDYSGSVGRSSEILIYRTAAGKHVVAIHHNTCWQGEHDTDEAAVYPSATECVAYLRDRCPGWMLQELIEGLREEAVAEEIDYWSRLICLSQNLHISQVKAVPGPLRYCTGHDAACPYDKATCDALYNVIVFPLSYSCPRLLPRAEPGARQGGA